MAQEPLKTAPRQPLAKREQPKQQLKRLPNPVIQPAEGDVVESEYADLLARYEAACEHRGITDPPTIMCRRIAPTGIKTREKLGSHVIAWLNCPELGGNFSSYPDLYADERQARAKVLAKAIEAISSEVLNMEPLLQPSTPTPPSVELPATTCQVVTQPNHLSNGVHKASVQRAHPRLHLGTPLNQIGLTECYVVQVCFGGEVFIMPHGEQQHKWDRLQYQYDPAVPVEQIEFGTWYVVESVRGPGLGRMYERARILCNLPSGASVAYFADNGHEEIVWPNQIFEIQNYEEVDAVRPQAVKVFIPNLKYPPGGQMPVDFDSNETYLVVPIDSSRRPPRVQLISKSTGAPFKISACTPTANGHTLK